ncbi:MAG: hypothetical protein NTZ60_02400 [Campylobacterales bacterium]|nr:hypothetical protein [Campylobacterales bacterium]
MIKLFFILFLPFALYAAKILSYNVYDRTDRVDVMITFDAPYNGAIKQSANASKIIIKLEDATIESQKTKELTSKFLDSLSITPIAGYTQIIASVPPSVTLKASKTADSYGLRLRFSNQAAQKENSASEQNIANSIDALPTKKGDEMSKSYYIVIIILIIGIIILFLLNKKITQNKSKMNHNSWLFNANQEVSAPLMTPSNQSGENVTIRFQKNLNEQNSVVMLEYSSQSYLVVMGANNLLLDKFTDNKPVTQDDFEMILQNKHQVLDNFLRGDDEEKEPLQIYKEKAGYLSYGA